MRLIKVTDRTPEVLKKSLLKFINRYGDGHITKKAIIWLNSSPFSTLKKENGDAIHIYLSKKNNIIGVIAIANYGLSQSIIVVHPKTRKKGIAQSLTKGVLEEIDHYYVKVANDNLPSLNLCFSVGMHAFHMLRGPTGKPTLVLGYGKWSSEEWFEVNK